MKAISLMVLALATAGAAAEVRAQETPAPPTAADLARLKSDVSRLQRELGEQKQLILNLMQSEQQRYDLLLQLIRSGGNTQGDPQPPPDAPLPQLPPVGPAKGSAPGEQAQPPRPVRGSITGQVNLPGNVTDAYVYVAGLRDRSGRGQELTIQQKDKLFVPRVAAVAIGTKVLFPNNDMIFHNVFSKSRGNAFDLGSQKGGTSGGSVTVTQPGHVEIFCNIHEKMRADVLVVPSRYWTKVNSDGSFRIDAVPGGNREIVLWAPGIKPTSRSVAITDAGARVDFATQTTRVTRHLNKFGQAYGSYNE